MIFLHKYRHKLSFSIVLLLGLFSCVYNDDYDTPDDICKTDSFVVANTTFSELKALYQGKTFQIQDDLIIEGYVISTDKEGNFFGSLHLQDKPENPSGGIELELDQRTLHLLYPTGKKVYVKLKGLYLANDKGTYKIGGVLTAFGNTSVGRLPAAKIKEHLYVSCEPQKNLKPVNHTELSELDSTKVNTLITLKNIELDPKSLCKTYAEPEKTTDHQLNDCNGNTIMMRTSGYSTFQSTPMPLGNGEITGVLTKEGDRYVLTIRDLEDVALVNNRCDSVSFYCEIPTENTTIEQIKELYQGKARIISEELFAHATIVANDHSGSFYKEIYIQDETGGIKIMVNETKLAEKGLKLGSQLVMAFKGLTIDKVDGELVLGYFNKDEFKGIEKEQFYRFFYLSDVVSLPSPKIVEIKNITEKEIGSLVQINEVQFKEETIFVNNNRDTAHELTDCFANHLKVAVSRRALYGDDLVPMSNGTIIGILQYDEGYQLRIRNMEDVTSMNKERCSVYENASAITIEELKIMYGNTSEEIKENIKLTGTITSDASANNLEPTRVFFQDKTGGIEIAFNTKHELLLNETVEIALLGTTFENSKNTVKIKNTDISHIIHTSKGVSPKSILTNIQEVFSEAYLYQLVEIKELQFKNNNTTFLSRHILTNCDEELALLIRKTAVFIGKQVPDGKGILTGIPTPDGFYVRNITDFDFTQPYKDCSSKHTSTEVFISEIADPDNSTLKGNFRFIELYNSGTKEVLLNNWKLVRYTNSNIEYSKQSAIDLSGYSIAPKSTFVIAANADTFYDVYGFPPDLEGGTGGAADSNGDDNIELIDGNGVVIDVFGIPGEDGSATNHEFEDGRALRKPEIVKNNTAYTFSEWELYNDTGAEGTIKKPQLAPQDFSPGKH